MSEVVRSQLTSYPQVPLLQVSGPLLVVQLLETPLLCLVSYARWAQPAVGARTSGGPALVGVAACGQSSVGDVRGLKEGAGSGGLMILTPGSLITCSPQPHRYQRCAASPDRGPREAAAGVGVAACSGP